MSDKKQFKSILDYKLELKNIIDALVPDIQFSYYAIMNNSSIQTYFNMISMDLYGYEYYQILRLNNLTFKVDEKTINLTVLEMIYNIIKQIVARKLRYSEYIAYDIYILPIRIEKYIHALNYKFEEIITPQKKKIFKLVSGRPRAVVEEVSATYHDDKINSIFCNYNATPKSEIATKLWYFNQLFSFIKEVETVVYQKFGKQFADDFLGKIERFKKIGSKNISEKDKGWVQDTIDELFNITTVILMIISDSKLAGIWQKIQQDEERRKEIEEAKLTIERAEKKLLMIESKKTPKLAKAKN